VSVGPRTVLSSRYLSFPGGGEDLLDSRPLPDRSSIHHRTALDCPGLRKGGDHEPSSGLLLDNSAQSFVALRGCDVSTCCTQRILKDNDAPQVTRRALKAARPWPNLYRSSEDRAPRLQERVGSWSALGGFAWSAVAETGEAWGVSA
jgi:hypothetical protein